jgi:hypothetical protein
MFAMSGVSNTNVQIHGIAASTKWQWQFTDPQILKLESAAITTMLSLLGSMIEVDIVGPCYRRASPIQGCLSRSQFALEFEKQDEFWDIISASAFTSWHAREIHSGLIRAYGLRQALQFIRLIHP